MFHFELTLSTNPMVYFFKLLLGGVFACTSLLLWVHIILYFLARPKGVPVANFLNELLNSVEIGDATFFSAVIFAYFAFYLLLCTLNGLVKFGLRIFIFFPIHPLK